MSKIDKEVDDMTEEIFEYLGTYTGREPEGRGAVYRMLLAFKARLMKKKTPKGGVDKDG